MSNREVIWGLTYKLLIAPAVVLGIALAIGIPRDLILRVTVLEAAMPSMITAGIIATQYGLRPELSAKLVAYGTLLAFATIPAWNAVLTLIQGD